MNNIKEYLVLFLVFIYSISLQGSEKTYKFFGVELNKKLTDKSILTGEYDLGNPLFTPKEINERFDKYILHYFPLSKKVYSIYAGSNWDTEKFQSQEECVRSRDYYTEKLIEKYNMNPNYEEHSTNIHKPVIISKDDGLRIVITCPGKWMSITFEDRSFIEEYKNEWKDYQLNELEKENDLTGM